MADPEATTQQKTASPEATGVKGVPVHCELWRPRGRKWQIARSATGGTAGRSSCLYLDALLQARDLSNQQLLLVPNLPHVWQVLHGRLQLFQVSFHLVHSLLVPLPCTVLHVAGTPASDVAVSIDERPIAGANLELLSAVVAEAPGLV